MLSINVEKRSSVAVVYLHGEISTETIKQFEIHTHNAIGQNITTLALDFKKIEKIDSTGISHLLKLSRKAILSDVELILLNLNVSLKKLFETAQMDKFFNVLSTEDFKEKYF